ncbi:MAG: HAMP domain-containing histidine kinase [Ignavibacteriaceae bacterium]|nr:HAMP domain-containing histidine kinase [Ignavibacteriaceae bacterium]
MNEFGEGILLSCDPEGTITKLHHNNISPLLDDAEGKLFPEIFMREKIGGALEFLMEIRNHRASFSRELFFPMKICKEPVYFNGVLNEGEIIILGSRYRMDLVKLLSDFMLMNNEQINTIRSLIKSEKDLKAGRKKTEDLYIDDMMKLNNELVSMHREMAKKNKELEEYNKLKNQFLGIAAHDLRNPLGQIYNILEIVEDDAGSLSQEMRNFIAMAKSRSQYMMSMLNELLDVSAIESGEINISPRPADIVSIVNAVINFNNHLAVKKGISINYDPPAEPLSATVDSSKIEQVITNFLTNAIKYSFGGSNIYITTIRSGNEFILSVKDEGQGIDEKELALLFRPFQKTSTKSTANEKSTGLGLFIVKKIIEAHKGRVWAESKPGAGSIFYFSVPLSRG